MASPLCSNHWTGRLPLLSVDQPLFAFANVVYKVKKSESEPHAKPTERFALSSALHTVTPRVVAANGASATLDIVAAVNATGPYANTVTATGFHQSSGVSSAPLRRGD